MRVLHTKTGQFHNFEDPREVRYAILSHVWAKGPGPHIPELTYQEARDLQTQKDEQNEAVSVLSRFPTKIRNFCKIAAEHGYDYAWTDACCINKTSSSELSEAINSMYDWYRYAGVCYVFLHDVPTPTSEPGPLARRGSPFRQSVWHQRGWTLQELLAPSVVVFLSSEWRIIGTKHTLAALLEDITKVDRDVLTGRKPLEKVSVACRMSWASLRNTTRDEDEAYSLLGIFGVNMRTNYGEGRYAFIRLQQEILKQIPDQTIFAWGPVLSPKKFSFNYDAPTDRADPDPQAASKETSSLDQYLLAPSPEAFKGSSHLINFPWDEFMQLFGVAPSHRPTYTITPYGIRAHLPLLSVVIDNAQTKVPTCVALLACKDPKHNDLMVLLIRSQPQQRWDYFVGVLVGELHELMGGTDNINPFPTTSTFSNHYYRMARLSLDRVKKFREQFSWEDIHVPHWPSLASYNLHRDVRYHTALRSTTSHQLKLSISPWSHEVLKANGYHIAQDSTEGSTIDIAHMSAPSETIRIDVRHCDCTFGREMFFLSADLVLDPPGKSIVAESRVNHEKHYPTHIQSWSFRNGVASKEFPVQLNGKSITVRLTFAKAVDSCSPSYTLGIEIWESEDAEETDDSDDFVPRGRSLSPRQVGKRKAKLPLRSSSPFMHSPPARALPKQMRQHSLALQELDEAENAEHSNIRHLTPEHFPSTSSRFLRSLVTDVAGHVMHTILGGNDTIDTDPPKARSWSHHTLAPGRESSSTTREFPRFASPERFAGEPSIPYDGPPDVLLDEDADAMRTSALRRLNGAYQTERSHRGGRGQSTSPSTYAVAKHYSDDYSSGDDRRQTGQWRSPPPFSPGASRMDTHPEEHLPSHKRQRSRHGDKDASRSRHPPYTPTDTRHGDKLVETPERVATLNIPPSPFVDPPPSLSLSSSSSPTVPGGDMIKVDEQGRRERARNGGSGLSHSTGEIPGLAPSMMAQYNDDAKARKSGPRGTRRGFGAFFRSLRMTRSTSK